MDSKLLRDGIDMMLYGMGSVVAFLVVLVFATMIMSAVMRRFFPDPEVTGLTGEGLETSARPMPDQRVLAVVKAAIALHRGKENSK